MLAADRLDAADPWAAAVLLHPHPDMGGNRHNNVVDALFRALPPAGVSTLRFDFGSSDVAAGAAQAVEALAVLADVGVPRFLVGYSFGGGVAATVSDPAVAGWFLVAPALALVEPTIGHDLRPKGIVTGEHDQWFDPDALREATGGWAATTVEGVAGADHFFAGRTDEVATRCLAWLREVAS